MQKYTIFCNKDKGTKSIEIQKYTISCNNDKETKTSP